MNWIIIVTTILSLMSTTGVAYASGDALPGEMLFPVKLLVENTRLWLASDNKDVEIIEDSLNRRIEEVGLLLENGSISNPDEITDIYQSRFDLLEKSLERIQARNPEEATRLRKELETRLQEQTRILENLLSGEKNSSNQMNHNTIQQMLEINQETHSRIKDEGTSGEQEMMDLAADVSNPNVEKNENNGQNNDQSNLDQGIGNGLKFSSQYLQDDRLKFEFQNEKNTIGDVYAQIDGNDYGCNQTGDKLTCDLSGSPGSGKLLILDAETNELIFSYQYQHEYAHLWEGLNEKAQDPKGQGNNDEQGLSDKGQSNHSNDGHDSQSNNKDKEK